MKSETFTLSYLTQTELDAYVQCLRENFHEDEVADDTTVEHMFRRWRVLTVHDGQDFLGGAHWMPLSQKSGPAFVGMDHVWVSPKAQGRGLARLLLDRCVRDMPQDSGAEFAFDTIRLGEGAQKRMGFWGKLGAYQIHAPMYLPLGKEVRENHIASILPLQGVQPLWSKDKYLEVVTAYLGSFFDGPLAVQALERIRRECPDEVSLTSL